MRKNTFTHLHHSPPLPPPPSPPPVRSPVRMRGLGGKTTCVSPLRSLQCRGGEMRTPRTPQHRNAHSSPNRDPAAASPPPQPRPASQRHGLEGNMANFDTLCTSREIKPCVVWRAAPASGWIESTITERLWQSRWCWWSWTVLVVVLVLVAWRGGGDLITSHHFYPGSSPTPPLRDDHGAGVHRRGCGSLSEHAGRRFLLRWQVRFRHPQHHHHPLLLPPPVSSSPHLRAFPARFAWAFVRSLSWITAHPPDVEKATQTDRQREGRGECRETRTERML